MSSVARSLASLFPAAAVFRHRDFRLFWFARVFVNFGVQIQSMAIAWFVYDRARVFTGIEEAAFLIGLVGLAQFVPIFALSLFGGQAADRYDRKKILLAAFAVEALCGLAFALLAADPGSPLWPVFVIAFGFGLPRAFVPAAQSSLQPTLVPRAEIPNAIAWGSLAWQSTSIIGPAAGGYLYAAGEPVPFLTAAALIFAGAMLMLLVRPPARETVAQGRSLALIFEGLRYVRSNRVVLGAISLDLFAVLLGGAVAMLPVYARDILLVGPDGLGHLRGAPAIGAAAVALWLAARPIRRHVGRWMFGGVAVFGAATVVFALSTDFWLSMAALALLGAGDMLSVYVRSSLIQLATPDEMRGRVAATSFIFISASNELGEFESGVMAKLMGVVPSVAFGGVAALGVAALWAYWFPELRKADRLA